MTSSPSISVDLKRAERIGSREWDLRRNPLLVLNLALDIVDGIGRLDLEGDGLSGKSLFPIE
jgi:hypothetical protein